MLLCYTALRSRVADVEQLVWADVFRDPEIGLLANYLILAIKCRRAASVEESCVSRRELMLHV
jgi:hypothetical protein